MKKTTLAFLTICLTGTLFAKPSPQDFFYKNGYRDGKKEGMRLGYSKAKREIMKSLKSRLEAIKAMEAGKYLSRKHKITAPQIYQVRRPDGSLSVLVKGCQLEKELTPNEILMLPKTPFSQAQQSNNAAYANPTSGNEEVGVSDGVFIPGIDAETQKPAKLASSMNGVVYTYFPNTEFYINILRTSGLPFTIVANSNDLKVRFESYKARNNFLEKYDLEPGRDAQ